MPFTFTPTAIPDVVLIEPKRFSDDRGWFSETFTTRDFTEAGLPNEFVQDNRSRSRRGVIRALHFQRDPMSQGKLVGCGRGAVYDVAVDLRVGSPTYAQWVGAELTEENGHLLWVPPGFGHGFAVLTEVGDLVYKCTQPYSGAHDGGVRFDDPEIGVRWPIDPADVIISDKDRDLPLLADCDHGFRF
jgi:dTDP-4-dehydrorhamnose 3,5-epimerase